MTRSDLVTSLANPNVEAFLAVIRHGETSQEASAYTELWGGGQFTGFSDHPRKHFPLPDSHLTTSAAGAYQITETTWNALVKQYGFEDFSPGNQDLAAIALLAGRHALDDVKAGRLPEAIAKLGQEWTSLALAKRQAESPAVFKQYGGTLAGDGPPPLVPDAQLPEFQPQDAAQPQEVKSMGILELLAAFGPTIVQMIPQLGAVFGSGSEVQKRNVAAATMVADTLVKATGSPNLQAAVESMRASPAALAAAKAAIDDIWPSISEAGSGGMDGARKANVAISEVPLSRDRSFIIACMFWPLVFMVVAASLLELPWLAKITNETRAMVIGFVMGTIAGGILAYFFGTNKDSSRKTDIIAQQNAG